MIKPALILGLLISINNAFSHSPNEVSFSIYEKETSILVDTEFPWSIRNAVFIYDTTLSNKSSIEEIHASLFDYVNQNFVLKEYNGKQIKLLQVLDSKNQGHHENFQFVFEKKAIGSIKNTLLFNFSKKQKNIHVLKTVGKNKKFVLTIEKPEIEFEQPTSYFYYGLFVCLILLSIISFFLLRKSKAFS